MTALDYLKRWSKSHLPKSVERGIKEPSNGDLRRWLNTRSVVINGKTPLAFEEIEFPITELVFFPKSKRRTTLWWIDKKEEI